MYLQHFNLKEYPFRTSPDSRFLYLSGQVNETLQKCLYMVDNSIGPLYVYGPIGTGKTTLGKRLEQQLEEQPERYRVAPLIIAPQLSVNGILRMMMDEFQVKTSRSYASSLQSIAAWLIAQHQAGIKPVLILDEAQNLTPTHLKLLHFLLNYETSKEKLLQMVLFGQNELSRKIEHFPELKSRMYPAALAAFSREDTASLIEFRWFVAGGEQMPFDSDVVDELFRVTLGLPREVVKVCDLSLLRAYSKGRKKVTADDVLASAGELNLKAA